MPDKQDRYLSLTHFDGRNAHKLTSLKNYFSEYAWDKYRVKIILKYLKFLVQNQIINQKIKISKLENIYLKFSINDEIKIKQEEKITNHDLKAILNWLEKRLSEIGLRPVVPYLNLGIGSEDINNIALRQQLNDSFHNVLYPEIVNIQKALVRFIRPLVNIPVMARTHGQPASVTTLGKELALFLSRMSQEFQLLAGVTFSPKFSGEVGNFNALKIIKPDIDWLEYEKNFLRTLGFKNSAGSTQIAPYSDITIFFVYLIRLNEVLLGFCRDIWIYASLGYLTITNIKNEVGSSGMPHKINPQFFEGAEGGLEFSISLMEFFCRKLSYNRLQRDFSDSTVRRNFVLAISYSLLSYQSIITGIERLEVNRNKIECDLNKHWEVMSEAITTILKFYGENNVFSKIKNKMRGQLLNDRGYYQLIKKLNLSRELENKLLKLRPVNLTGESEKIAGQILRSVKFKKRL